MADPALRSQDPYEDDVSGQSIMNDKAPAAQPERYFSPMVSLLTIVALFAAIVVVAVGSGHREQQAQQQPPQTQTAPSTTGSAR
jgi:hypothetical protein